MSKHKFSKFIYAWVDQGDRITYYDKKNKIEFIATIWDDDCNMPPDQHSEGFWPSLDPQSAGYIGPKSRRALAYHHAKAEEIMRSWRNDEWRYVGIAVTAHKADVQLTDDFVHALWGIESTSPGYLREVAEDLLTECRDEALEILQKLAA